MNSAKSVAIALGSVVIVAAGCGDGGSSSSPTTTTTPFVYECQSLALRDVDGLLNSGRPDQAFAVKARGRSAGGRAVYAVRLDRGGRSYVLLHDAPGAPGSSGWTTGLWAAHDSTAAGATGFPLNSGLANPYPTDSVAAVMGCG